MALLELRNVGKKYGDFTVIDGFNLTVNKGELRCLLGPNGAGKTTCMDLISGRQKLTSGQVFFQGEDITGVNPSTSSCAGVSAASSRSPPCSRN